MGAWVIGVKKQYGWTSGTESSSPPEVQTYGRSAIHFSPHLPGLIKTIFNSVCIPGSVTYDWLMWITLYSAFSIQPPPSVHLLSSLSVQPRFRIVWLKQPTLPSVASSAGFRHNMEPPLQLKTPWLSPVDLHVDSLFTDVLLCGFFFRRLFDSWWMMQHRSHISSQFLYIYMCKINVIHLNILGLNSLLMIVLEAMKMEYK